MPQPSFADFLERRRSERLDGYKSNRPDVTAHTNSENRILNDGYETQQIIELVQNGADAISDGSQENIGRICVSLLNEKLYVANTGSPFSEEGVESLLNIDYSPKRKNEIGRYGLGFKSLLKLGGQVDVLSTSGSLQLNPTRCQCEIRKLLDLPGDHLSPRFRLAWPVDRREEASRDQVLEEFAWATTVVRAKIADDSFPQTLRREIREFPSEFLLFLATDVILELNDGDGPPRVLRRESDGEDFILHDGENSSRWRVLQRQVRISDEKARADGGDLHRRDSVPLAWAVPLDAKRDIAGYFWAFFPTQTLSRLPGILNAPWKLSSGREHLADRSPWNEALMLEAASLVVENLPSFSHQEDPGHILDLLPRKLRQGQSEIAAPLVSSVLTKLKDTEIVPDGNGKLRQATELKLPPLDASKQDWVALHSKWERQASEEIKSHWVHSTCLDPNRVSRLKELERDKVIGKSSYSVQAVGVSAVDSWLGAIASATAEEAKVVLSLADNYAQKRELNAWNQEKSRLKIIPTDSGQTQYPDQVVIASPGAAIPGRESVLQELTVDPESSRIMRETLGVISLDWQQLLNADLMKGEWGSLWGKLRAAPENIRDAFVAAHSSQINVLRHDGKWVLPDEVLLPGKIVTGYDDPANHSVLISEEHTGDLPWLVKVGVGDTASGEPRSISANQQNQLLNSWLNKQRSEYRRQLPPNSSNPQNESLYPFSLSMPGGWVLLSQLHGLANSRMTERLLETSNAYEEQIEFGHTKQRNNKPIKVQHPLFWYIHHYGSLAVGKHAVPMNVVIDRSELKSLERVPAWNSVKPRLSLFHMFRAPQPSRKADLQKLWHAFFDEFATADAIKQDSLGWLWTEAAKDNLAPSSLRTPDGEIPLGSVFVTSSRSMASHARQFGKLVVTIEDADARNIWCANGAVDLARLLKPAWDGFEDDEVTLLTDAVPELSEVLKDDAKPIAVARWVGNLHLQFGEDSSPVPCLHSDGILYRDRTQLEKMLTSEQLHAVLDQASAAGWLKCSLLEARGIVASEQVTQRRAYVREGVNEAERLLRAVGGRCDALRQVIGEAACRAIPDDCSMVRIAELALALRGPAILQELKDILDAEGLQPPGRWWGSKVREFVSSIGFPETYAIASEAKRDAEESVDGPPVELNPLHDFQSEVFDALRELIDSGTGRRRRIVSLPTGAGKTRVTVQSAVELVLKPLGDNRTVLWVAQQDELCEQAVQSFRQVWRILGAENDQLRIVRFWGSQPDPAPSPDNTPTVVVATIQTMNARMGNAKLDWLAKPGLVVVDECHHAITKSYTGLLRWLDAEAPRVGTVPKDEPPVIGLSATPFRGSRDEDESRQLARRFDNLWLPSNQEALYEKLTERRILAKAIYEELDIPFQKQLPNDLLELLGFENLDGIGAQNAATKINEFLAPDENQNEALVRFIAESPERSILFFARTVGHAIEMAARLNIQGISAAAVSGDTPSSARRHFLDKFKAGNIRVMCNWGVLTTGFDAPKVDMVLIPRVVFSAVSYMQMVGRGLRGTLNAGTESCRIVTVPSNLGQYGSKQAYHFCKKYFNSMDGR